MATFSVAEQLRARHGVIISPDTVATQFRKPHDVASLYSQVLEMDFRDVTEPGVLPRDLGSQVSAEVSENMLLQVVGVRDVTQPLRPCADMSEEEAFLLGAPGQQSGGHKGRLLKLVVTDGHHTVPLIELKTHLNVFKDLPLPGEKVLVKKGARVDCGMIIIASGFVERVGGGVEQLRNDFLLRRKGIPLGKGAVGVPKFSPFVVADPFTKSSHRFESGREGAEGDRGRGDGGRGRGDGSRGRGDGSRGRGDGGRGRGDGSRGRGDSGRGDNAVHQPTRQSVHPPRFTEENFPALGGGDY